MITGDRNYKNEVVAEAGIKLIASCYEIKGTSFAHGECRGADKLVGGFAEKYGFEVKKFPAEWDKYGRAAGPIRNKEMVDLLPNVVMIFHDNLKESVGTKDCVKQVLKKIKKETSWQPIFILNAEVITKEELEKIM